MKPVEKQSNFEQSWNDCGKTAQASGIYRLEMTSWKMAHATAILDLLAGKATPHFMFECSALSFISADIVHKMGRLVQTMAGTMARDVQYTKNKTTATAAHIFPPLLWTRALMANASLSMISNKIINMPRAR
jgi:hypothetical protein